MSSSEEADDVPTYAVVDKKKKKNHSVPEKRESDISDSNIPMYAVVDKKKKSNNFDSTYDVITLDDLPNEGEESISGDVTKKKKKGKVKKLLSESLHDKRFLCLLVAIIVIIVTFCMCFLLAFIQISELRSEKASLQVSKSKIT